MITTGNLAKPFRMVIYRISPNILAHQKTAPESTAQDLQSGEEFRKKDALDTAYQKQTVEQILYNSIFRNDAMIITMS